MKEGRVHRKAAKDAKESQNQVEPTRELETGKVFLVRLVSLVVNAVIRFSFASFAALR
jgi:hypothetical protein